jgi:hypothetical protein
MSPPLQDSRSPVFAELDRLIAAGVTRPARARIPRIGATRADLYNLRRQAHPRHYRQDAEPWQDRRAAYLAGKGLPAEMKQINEFARKPSARVLLAGGQRAIAAGVAAC